MRRGGLSAVLVLAEKRRENGVESFVNLGLTSLPSMPLLADGSPEPVEVGVYLAVLRGDSRRRAVDVEVQVRGVRGRWAVRLPDRPAGRVGA